MRRLKKFIPNKLKDAIWDIITFVKLKVFQLKHPNFLIRKESTDFKVFKEIFVKGEFSLTLDFNPEIIVDAGAYTGISSLYFNMQYPQAKIICIEPELSNFNTLLRNTSHKKNQIIALNMGLWHKSAYLKIVDNNLGNWGFSVEEVHENDTFNIKSVSISDILANYNYDKIDILKIDIEGSEKELFENNTAWIDKVNVIIIELHDRFKNGCKDAVFSKLNSQEWDSFIQGEKVIFKRKSIILN